MAEAAIGQDVIACFDLLNCLAFMVAGKALDDASALR
jgi:hypothetical protein